MKQYFQELRERLIEFHNGSEYDLAILFNQRPFFESDWDGSRINENMVIQVSVDKLVNFTIECLNCDLESFERAVEFALSAAYSMNHITLQSPTDKKLKLKYLRDRLKQLHRDLSIPTEVRIEKERQLEALKTFIEGMEFEKHNELNRRNRLAWQTKHALVHLKKFIDKNLCSHKPRGLAREVFVDYEFRPDSMSNSIVLTIAILNYLGVHVTYDQAVSFYTKEFKGFSITNEDEYTNLFGRLDWNYFLEQLVSKK